MPVNYYPSQDSSIQCTPPRRDNFFRVQAVADPKPADNRGGGGLVIRVPPLDPPLSSE